MTNVYRLVKPIGQLKEVQIKSLKMKFLMGLSDEDEGTAIYKMLASVTDVSDFNIFRQMSVLDAILILFAVWRKSYHKDSWINKNMVCECGAAAINLAKHKIDGTYVLPEVYSKPVEVAAYNDNDELQRFQVKLRPICLDLVEKGVMNKGVNASQLLFTQVESIDGAEPSQDLPLSVWSQINDLLPNDMDEYQRLTQVKLNCGKCSKELISEVGFSNFDWIQGK